MTWFIGGFLIAYLCQESKDGYTLGQNNHKDSGCYLFNNLGGNYLIIFSPRINSYIKGFKCLTVKRNQALFIFWTHYPISSPWSRGLRNFSSKSVKKQQNLSLVVWGTNLPSSVGSGRFTKQESNMIKLPPFQYSVVIGLILSDGWVNIGSTNKNARLGFEQSEFNYEYLWYTFFILSHYCSSLPRYRTRSRWDKIINSYVISSRALLCFTEIYNLFYINRVKRIPENIYNILTPIALAHMIMGDGLNDHGFGLILCTDSFPLQDVVRLINVLIIRYNLECNLRQHYKEFYRIYIKTKSMPLLRSIVSPYMHKTMLYKITAIS